MNYQASYNLPKTFHFTYKVSMVWLTVTLEQMSLSFLILEFQAFFSIKGIKGGSLESFQTYKSFKKENTYTLKLFFLPKTLFVPKKLFDFGFFFRDSRGPIGFKPDKKRQKWKRPTSKPLGYCAHYNGLAQSSAPFLYHLQEKHLLHGKISTFKRQ